MDQTVDIPEVFLLTIAAHGNMGDGELPKIMQIWAQKECVRLGLGGKLKELQNERLNELEKRLRNVLGDNAVNQIGKEIGQAAAAFNLVKKAQK